LACVVSIIKIHMTRFANLLSPLKFFKDWLLVNLGVRQIFCLALIGELV